MYVEDGLRRTCTIRCLVISYAWVTVYWWEAATSHHGRIWLGLIRNPPNTPLSTVRGITWQLGRILGPFQRKLVRMGLPSLPDPVLEMPEMPR